MAAGLGRFAPAAAVCAALAALAWLLGHGRALGVGNGALEAAGYGYFALLHLRAWLIQGELSMGHVGPSLWHDLVFPVVVFWVIRRR